MTILGALVPRCMAAIFGRRQHAAWWKSWPA
jgi:hypothetical protein